jgi:hypothetical protein
MLNENVRIASRPGNYNCITQARGAFLCLLRIQFENIPYLGTVRKGAGAAAAGNTRQYHNHKQPKT